MSTSIRGTQNNRKKVGRPKTTGRGAQIGMRWHGPLLQAIDAWASKQDDKPPRPEAIRRLVQHGLASEGMELPADVTRASKPKKATKAAPPKKMRKGRA